MPKSLAELQQETNKAHSRYEWGSCVGRAVALSVALRVASHARVSADAAFVRVQRNAHFVVWTNPHAGMSYLKKVKKQTGYKQYFKILILCEGRTLPDIDQAAVEEECRNVMIQTGGRDRRDKPANNGGRGWELELPGENALFLEGGWLTRKVSRRTVEGVADFTDAVIVPPLSFHNYHDTFTTVQRYIDSLQQGYDTLGIRSDFHASLAQEVARGSADAASTCVVAGCALARVRLWARRSACLPPMLFHEISRCLIA